MMLYDYTRSISYTLIGFLVLERAKETYLKASFGYESMTAMDYVFLLDSKKARAIIIRK